jgi:D-beta-D-heptose 7-phosphate kinase/D-beta-D-heptose 1-phosphate adenosyltransferase
MHHQQFTALIDQFPQSKVLCLGDIMLDQFIYGSVDRISPEAPVPIFHIQRRIEMLGGAGNVVRNLASLHGKVHFIGVVGHDLVGKKIDDQLKKIEHVSFDLVQDTHRCSTQKVRYVSGSHQLLRVDEEFTGYLDQGTQDQVLKLYEKALAKVDVVVFSDYAKGFFTPAFTQRLIQLANKMNVPTIIDPKGKNYNHYKDATLLTPNLKELEAVTATTLSSEDAIVSAAEMLRDLLQLPAVLVTRSRDGMTLVQDGKEPIHIATVAQEVYDVSGAGDTVIATLALSIAAQGSFETAANLANQAAGIVVKKVGTATVSPQELRETIESSNNYLSPHAIVSRETALEQILSWQRNGLKVGFTNGCFDILHTGHVSLLEQARNKCDRLVVALNSDLSVKRLKGETRPINEEFCRAKLLASLSVVDLVVIFDEDTPLALINHLKPNLLVKGADYTIDKVVGAKEVASWGGEVYLAELVPDMSTTKIIKKAA